MHKTKPKPTNIENPYTRPFTEPVMERLTIWDARLSTIQTELEKRNRYDGIPLSELYLENELKKLDGYRRELEMVVAGIAGFKRDLICACRERGTMAR